MKNAIVITTINAPTAAVLKLAEKSDDWDIVVVGDNKTPADWSVAGTSYLSMEGQRDSEWKLAPLLPENHYCRKNLGYLEAIKRGASIVAETDDDNFPLNWPPLNPTREHAGTRLIGEGWLNVYKYFTAENIWPRGLPLDEIESTATSTEDGNWASSVQQYLAAGDPDVDAIYRLAIGKIDHSFEDRSVVLAKDLMVPFNSQSTVWFAEAFPYLYLPSFVSFRMTDIWRSFVAQVCLWAQGLELSYHGLGVFQERNEHDLMRDFRDEIIGYDRNAEIARGLRSLALSSDPDSSAANLLACYAELRRLDVVDDRELDLVNAWLVDLRSIDV